MFNMINVVINITNNNYIYNSNLNTNKYNKIKNVNHEENKQKETHMSNQQQHKVLINKTYYHFHLIFPSSSPTFSLQTEQQLEESGTLQKTDTIQSAGRYVICDGQALLAAAPHHPELRKNAPPDSSRNRAPTRCAPFESPMKKRRPPPPNQMQREKTATIP